MGPDYSVAIDFDGTVTDVDIIDAVLQSFAPPEWREVEALWEQGIIGSRECLERQMSMVEQPLSLLLAHIDDFSIDETFGDFARFLARRNIPYAVVSDGFQVFIERLLRNAGLNDVPVLANIVSEEKGRLKTIFPYSDSECGSANCKCTAVTQLSKGRPLIVIGDGRSDFCLSHRATRVFSKKKLTGYCRTHEIPHTPFESFREIQNYLTEKRSFISALNSLASGKD